MKALTHLVPLSATRILPLLIALAVTVFAAGSAPATTIYSTGFEPPAYSPGTIHGQNGWIATSDSTIQTAVVQSGTQALHVTATSPFVIANQNLNYALGGATMVTLQVDFLRSGAGEQSGIALYGDTGFLAQIFTFGGGNYYLGNSSTSTGFQPFADDVWHNLQMDFNLQTLMVTGFVDGNSLGTLPLNFDPTALTALQLYSSGGNAGAQDVYFDNLSISASVPDSGATALLLGIGLVGISCLRWKVIA
jgi:VPDSG-CTERM motif